MTRIFKMIALSLAFGSVSTYALESCPGGKLGVDNYRTFKEALVKNKSKFEMLNDGLRCKVKTRGFIIDENAWGCTELQNIQVAGRAAPVLASYEFLDETQTLATSSFVYPMGSKAALDDLKNELSKNYALLTDPELKKRLQKTPQGMVFVESFQKEDLLVTLLKTPEQSKLQVMVVEFVRVQDLAISRENLDTCATGTVK